MGRISNLTTPEKSNQAINTIYHLNNKLMPRTYLSLGKSPSVLLAHLVICPEVAISSFLLGDMKDLPARIDSNIQEGVDTSLLLLGYSYICDKININKPTFLVSAIMNILKNNILRAGEDRNETISMRKMKFSVGDATNLWYYRS